MKSLLFLFLVSVILAFSNVAAGDAAIPDGSTTVTSSPSYWIHIDPVPDKHVNDTLVITGSTNIPAGEIIHITTSRTQAPRKAMHDPTIFWSRELDIRVETGPGGQNTFTTPVIAITPSETNEKVRVDDEYYVMAEYRRNSPDYVETSQIYWIWAPDVSRPFWIRIDPVPDKHANDSFVITGATNIPAGEEIKLNITLSTLPTWTPKEDIVDFFYREYSIRIQEGEHDNNTFTTPVIRIQPSRMSNGTLKRVWPGEYRVLAEYSWRPQIRNDTYFLITAPDALPVVSQITGRPGHDESTGIPGVTPQKSPVSQVLAIVALCFIGGYMKRLKK